MRVYLLGEKSNQLCLLVIQVCLVHRLAYPNVWRHKCNVGGLNVYAEIQNVLERNNPGRSKVSCLGIRVFRVFFKARRKEITSCFHETFVINVVGDGSSYSKYTPR